MAMTATPIFALTAEDVQRKLNPLGLPHLFAVVDVIQPGESDAQILRDDVDDVLLEREDYVCSRLPERYRRLLRHVDGEVLTPHAIGGEATATLALTPTEGTVRLYRNYRVGRPWRDRNPHDTMEASEYAVDGRVVTLSTAMANGERLYAEYDHAAAGGCRTLRTLVLNMACAEWARRLPLPGQEFERYRDWETQAYSDLKRMQQAGDGRLGVDMFDNLSLVDEIRGVSNVQRSPMIDW